MKILFYSLLLLSILCVSGSKTSWAAPGDFDGNFGTGGIAIQDIDGNQNFIGAGALQSDGKLIVISTAGTIGNRDYAAYRLDTDGQLDTNFGTNGISTTDATGGDDIPNAILILPDDKILLIGGNDLSLVRYNADGTLDDSFGTNGVQTMTPPIANSFVTGAALQSDGKILITGDDDGDSAYVTRLQNDGSSDSEFGTNGSVILKINDTATVTRGISLQSSGAIIITGFSSDTGLFVAQLSPEGSTDTSFGSDGLFAPEFTGGLAAFPGAVTVHSDDSIGVVAGLSDDDGINTPIALLVLRLNANGGVIESFGDSGIATIDLSPDSFSPSAIAIQRDASVVVGGSVNPPFSIESDFIVARLDPGGALDANFASGGSLNFNEGTQDDVRSILVLGNGQILATGTTSFDMAAFRLLGNSAELQISKVSSTSEVSVGDTIDFTIEISNDGPDRAGATLTDMIPSGLTVAESSISIDDGSCTLNGALICSVGVAAGDSTTLMYSGSSDTEGDFTNAVTITSQVEESDISDNSASVSFTVVPGGGCSLRR